MNVLNVLAEVLTDEERSQRLGIGVVGLLVILAASVYVIVARIRRKRRGPPNQP